MDSRPQLVELLVTRYGVPEDRITDEATLVDLGLDSLSVAELVFDVEGLFGFEVSDQDAGINTFGEVVALVDRHRPDQAS